MKNTLTLYLLNWESVTQALMTMAANDVGQLQF